MTRPRLKTGLYKDHHQLDVISLRNRIEMKTQFSEEQCRRGETKDKTQDVETGENKDG